MRVILPNGQIREYRNANYAVRNRSDFGFTDLYRDKNQKTWVAQVPNSCLIETDAADIRTSSDDRRLQQLEFKIDRAVRSIQAATRKPQEKVSPGIQRALDRNRKGIHV